MDIIPLWLLRPGSLLRNSSVGLQKIAKAPLNSAGSYTNQLLEPADKQQYIQSELPADGDADDGHYFRPIALSNIHKCLVLVIWAKWAAFLCSPFTGHHHHHLLQADNHEESAIVMLSEEQGIYKDRLWTTRDHETNTGCSPCPLLRNESSPPTHRPLLIA